MKKFIYKYENKVNHKVDILIKPVSLSEPLRNTVSRILNLRF